MLGLSPAYLRLASSVASSKVARLRINRSHFQTQVRKFNQAQFQGASLALLTGGAARHNHITGWKPAARHKHQDEASFCRDSM